LARFLALDWDNREYHLVAANINRGKVQIQSAISWRADEPFIPANAERFGEQLKQRLKTAGIAPAPLLVGLGRDRVVVREVRYPQVPSDVESLVVRNQIVKELTESADEVFIDYAPLAEPAHSGEQRALSLVVKKDVVQALQTICRVAGLKLASVTARPFGLAACYKHLAGTTPHVPLPPEPRSVVAVLAVSGTWAEFCAVRGRQLLFARSMTPGDGLFGEIRRNLAAYSGQPQLSFPRDAIQAVYVCGNGENAVLREKLQETLGIPVYGLDPFVREERIDIDTANRSGFTGAVGLLHIWAADEATPVNFVKPRESKPKASPMRKYLLIGGAAALLAIGMVIAAGIWVSSLTEETRIALRAERDDYERQLKGMSLDIKYLDALREWNDGAIPWIDELYDVAARVPSEGDNRVAKGFRVTRIKIVPITEKAAKGTVPAPTVIKDKIAKAGTHTVALASTNQITPRYVLTINKNQPDQEIITVDAVSGSKITAYFAKEHEKGATVEKTMFTARMTIEGQVEEPKATLVQKYMSDINKDKHCRCSNPQLKRSASGQVDFTLSVDIAHQLPQHYLTRLVPPAIRAEPEPKKKAAPDPDGDEPDGP